MFVLKNNKSIGWCLFFKYVLKILKIIFVFILKKNVYLHEFLIHYDFFEIDVLFWFKLKVDVRIIWKNWKLKNFKKFKIFKLDEDEEK